MLPAQLEKEAQKRAIIIFFIGQDVSAEIVIKKAVIKQMREKN